MVENSDMDKELGDYRQDSAFLDLLKDKGIDFTTTNIDAIRNTYAEYKKGKKQDQQPQKEEPFYTLDDNDGNVIKEEIPSLGITREWNKDGDCREKNNKTGELTIYEADGNVRKTLKDGTRYSWIDSEYTSDVNMHLPDGTFYTHDNKNGQTHSGDFKWDREGKLIRPVGMNYPLPEEVKFPPKPQMPQRPQPQVKKEAPVVEKVNVASEAHESQVANACVIDLDKLPTLKLGESCTVNLEDYKEILQKLKQGQKIEIGRNPEGYTIGGDYRQGFADAEYHNGIVIDAKHADVSRRHATIWMGADGKLRLIDGYSDSEGHHPSTNGTRIVEKPENGKDNSHTETGIQERIEAVRGREMTDQEREGKETRTTEKLEIGSYRKVLLNLRGLSKPKPAPKQPTLPDKAPDPGKTPKMYRDYLAGDSRH